MPSPLNPTERSESERPRDWQWAISVGEKAVKLGPQELSDSGTFLGPAEVSSRGPLQSQATLIEQ